MAGYDFFEKILFEMTLYAVEHNHGLKFTMQTNGILLDDKMAALLDKYNVLVSFSFDGIANRVSRRYKEPKFVNDIKTGLYIIGPLTIDNLIKDYEIRKVNEQNFSCQWIYPVGNQTTDEIWNNDVDGALQKYLEYVDYYIDDIHGNIDDRNLNEYICAALGKPMLTCTFTRCYTSPMFTVDNNRNIYKCDERTGEGYSYIGKIGEFEDMEDILQGSKAITDVLKQKTYQRQKYCTGCEYRTICAGGCWMRSLQESNGEKPYSFFCKSNKVILPHIYKRLSNLTPEEMVKINPRVRVLLVENLYIPCYLKEELFYGNGKSATNDNN